jgi:signal peptidase I
MTTDREKNNNDDALAAEGDARESALEDIPLVEPAEEAASPAAGGEIESKSTTWAEIRSWLRDLVIAVAICIVLIVYVAQPFRVEKTSMEPLLHDGDRIIVSKVSLLFEPVARGDVVVLMNPRNPDESWIKRVVGLPGEEIRIENGVVQINGAPLQESYLPEDGRRGRNDTYPSDEADELARENFHAAKELLGFEFRPNPHSGGRRVLVQRIPDGYYFVLGDNRNHSMDSRISVFDPEGGGPGLIPARYIYGKAVFRYWPLDKIGFIAADRPSLQSE